jgi:hypothetical protein
MSHQLEIIRREDPESDVAETTKLQREAFAWLVSQLMFERTLEVLRNQGPAPDQRQEYLAA